MAVKSLITRLRGRKVSNVVNSFQSETTEILGREEPLLARATVYLLLSMVLAFVTWASISELDKVVMARSVVETVAPRAVVQPMTTAMIKSINVAPGEVVKAGQVLGVLDNTFTKADNNQLEAKLRSLEAQIARLTAERDGKDFTPDVAGQNGEYLGLQLDLFQERRQQYRARLQGYEERAGELKVSVAKRRKEIEILSSRFEVGKEVEEMRRTLYEKETGSRLNYLASRNTRLEMEQNLETARSNLRELTHQLESAEAERRNYVQGWKSQVAEELAKVRAERDGVHEQLTKAERLAQLVELRAPMDAVVFDIVEKSVGSIVREGETVFRLVPMDSDLEIVAYIRASDIGSIAVGNEVHIKLDAFNYAEHGTISAYIRSISSDAYTAREVSVPGADPLTAPPGTTYYKARLDILSMDLYNMPKNFALIPGMTAMGEVKVGKRSIMGYLLSPVLKSFDEGMREP